MKECSFRIMGKRPLVQNNPAKMKRAEDGPKRKTIPTPEVEAESGAYRFPDGSLYIKSEAFRGSLLKACSGLKIQKMSAKVVMAAGVFTMDEFLPLIHPTTGKPLREYEIYTCRAVVMGKGVLRSRPRLNEWSCVLRVEYDDEIMTPQTIEQLLQRAGQFVGVGDQRPGAPQTPGQFGTYTVEVMPESPTAKRKTA